MRFNSNSILMDGGIPARIDVYIPSALLDIDIGDKIWQKAVKDFNILLDSRTTTRTKILDTFVDALRLEIIEEKFQIGSIVLLFVAQEDDIPKIANIHFCLTGYLTFASDSGKVIGMVIKNITYGGDNSKKYLVFDNINVKDL